MTVIEIIVGGGGRAYGMVVTVKDVDLHVSANDANVKHLNRNLELVLPDVDSIKDHPEVGGSLR